MKKIDMVGKRFGKLVVIGIAESYFDGKRKRSMCLCKCDCGEEKILRIEDIKKGDTKSCGCLRKELLEINLLGKRFGKLVVIGKANRIGKSSSTFWECLCNCGKKYVASSQHLREGDITSCGCRYERTDEEELSISKENFFKNINKSDGCWEWTGCKMLGYGVLQYRKKAIKAHRFSYLIHNGSIDEKKFICHKCDNKACVNPDHLYQGTKEDNARDASERKRLPYGEKCRSAKLTEKDVIKILKSDLSTNLLMSEYGVSRNTILRIKSRKSWKHVDI